MQNHYILIDFENVHVKSLALLQGGGFHVRIFLGPKNMRLPTDLVLAMKSLGDNADYIQLQAGGHNALDFHITYYLGRLAAVDPAGSFYIVSKDTGFDSLLAHMTKSGIDCARAVSIDALPCVVAPLTSDVDSAVVVKVASDAKLVVKRKAAELVELILANLAKRKSAAPRTEKTLRSTIKMLCGAHCSDKEVDAVFNRLVKKKYVITDGVRVSYNLAADDQ